MKLRKIAHIKNNFRSKFGAPRQSGLISESMGRIVFEKEFSNPDAIRGLEDFSHIWVLWEFSESKHTNWSPTVRPPLLGGNKRMGVFATRSPFRPNPIGLSVLKLEKIDKKGKDISLIVSGCDMIDKTPIFDIKPYLPYADSIPCAKGGFAEGLSKKKLKLEKPDSLWDMVPSEVRAELEAVLKSDPRPAYQDDPMRIYGLLFANLEVKFKVEDDILTITDIVKV